MPSLCDGHSRGHSLPDTRSGASTEAQGLSGRLWQGRFFSCPLDEAHVWAAVRRVERNPVREGLVARAELHPWSSAAAHYDLAPDPLLTPLPGLPSPGADWRAWLGEQEEDEALVALRRHTRTGRPLGNMTFIEQVQALLGRVARPRKGGRPRKARGLRQKHG